MGIWRQRIEGSWLRCLNNYKFRIINLKGGNLMNDFINVVSLKHESIDYSLSINTADYGTTNTPAPTGLVYDGIGDIGNGTFSYPIDYYFGPSINDTKSFNKSKNYQFKTHVINFAYMDDSLRTDLNNNVHLNTNTAIQPNPKLYNSELNCHNESLGIDPSWGDLHFLKPPYYNSNSFSTNPMSEFTPTTHILYYYSSPTNDTESGYVTYTNRLKPSNNNNKKDGTQSVYQATYGISGVEINEIGWKIQGYSFVSYDNNPSIGNIGTSGSNGFGITNSYSEPNVEDPIVSRTPLKYCVYGKGWYYDDLNNEYTWYHRLYNNTSMDKNNNPVGGDIGFQESNDGYIENNYIAKYIPFQKFNLSFLYENLRPDAGIKVYLSPTLPSSKATESSKYVGDLEFPTQYYTSIPPNNLYTSQSKYSLVNNQSQISDGGLPFNNGSTYSITTPNVYAWVQTSTLTTNWVYTYPNSSYSTIIQDSKEIVNNIYVDDDTNIALDEIKVNLTLRHTGIGDLIINLRAPNGNVINLKAKGSGQSFNDLRNITFTTNTSQRKMRYLNWWPNGSNLGYIWDPIGVTNSTYPITNPTYPLNAPWLPTPYNFDYNFKWSQIRIVSGLTFQMDKVNGEGGSATLVTGANNWSNIINTGVINVDFRSNVNDLRYLLNSDGTFKGTYSLYIKDDKSGDTGLLEDWNIEFLYKKNYTPILTLTQSDPSNVVNKGAPKLQYLFGLEGNQYLFIVGDKIKYVNPTDGSTQSVGYVLASLKNLKIDGGFHDANNKQYLFNDKIYGLSNSTIGNGGNTFEIGSDIENISYSNYVGSGDLNNTTTLSISGVTAKIGNGKFKSGIWENGAWNSGWRYDENLQEFYNIDQFFSYNRDKTWRFSVFGSKDATSKFEIGDKVSMGNIVAIDVNEERKIIKSYFTIVAKTQDSISVEFESDFPIRRIKIDSVLHRIYVTKNVWLTGAFLNGYFTGVWNNGLFKGFPYITEMFNSHWIDGKFDGGHFYSRKKSIEFSNTYLATLSTIKLGLIFDTPHRLTEGDIVTLSSTFSAFDENGETKVLSIVDDYKLIVDLDWDSSKDPNTYGGKITGTVETNISTGLIQNLDFSANNVSPITSLQSMDSTRVFIYDSWMDVNFDTTSSVNIGKPQSKIDNSISSYSYSENNLYGYPTYDILSSDVTFRDSFSTTIRKYKLGSKYKVYQDYIGDAGNFDEYFDITGWSISNGNQLPTSQSFLNQGWVINKYSNSNSNITFERTSEALDSEDVVAGKEMKVKSIGKGGVLNIQPAYDVANRTNSSIERMRYTVVKFDLLKSLVPDFIFEDSSSIYKDDSKYQPLIHFNNLNYVTRRVYTPGSGYSDNMLNATYFPVYKNINHVESVNKTKIEYFYNKRNLSMSFRGNGLDGSNVSEFVVDNLKLYEVDMIPFFQYFTQENINRSVSIPYQGIAPYVDYIENDYSLIDKSIYGIDSFYIFQPTSPAIIQNESEALIQQFSLKDPVINNFYSTNWRRPPYRIPSDDELLPPTTQYSQDPGIFDQSSTWSGL